MDLNSIFSDIAQYIATHWLEWAVIGIGGLSTYLYKRTKQHVNGAIDKNEAMAEGVQALLRSKIIGIYNHYKDMGYCPIYAKENIQGLYIPYEELGGNGVARKMVAELLDMPTEPKGDEKNGQRNIN